MKFPRALGKVRDPGVKSEARRTAQLWPAAWLQNKVKTGEGDRQKQLRGKRRVEQLVEGGVKTC